MSVLDRITNKNFVDHPPFFTVYDYWYNLLVDLLNNMADTGRVNSAILGDIPIVAVPSETIVFFDDFLASAATDAPLAAWTVTEDDAACTQLLIDAAGGVLQLTNKATTDDNAQQIQLQQECFRLVSGKELWFEARIRVPDADVTNIDLFVGLSATEDLTGVADNMPANGFGFIKTDAGVGTVFLESSDNGTNIVSGSAVTTLVTNTWVRLGFKFNGGATGSATITPYINGVAGSPITSVTYATMTEVAPVAMVRNGDATTTQILDIDYIHIVQER